MISYAQNFEDVILHRALKHIKDGFYIDIGAQDETIDSVSKAFYEMGWRGVHVEPVPAYAERLRSERKGDTVLEVVISTSRDRVGFFSIPGTGISTGNMALAQSHRAAGHEVQLIEVDSLPLSELLDNHKDRDIHWLKIDVEGMEAQVIQSWQPSQVRPWVVVIESTKPGTPEPNHEAWDAGVLALGYDFVYFDGLNRFYVSHEHSELKSSFNAPPNCFDGFVLPLTHRASILMNQQLTQATESFEASRIAFANTQAELNSTNLRLQEERDAQAQEQQALVAAKQAEVARLEPLVARLTNTISDLRAQSAQALAKAKKDLLETRVRLLNTQREIDEKNAGIADRDSSAGTLQVALTSAQAYADDIRRQLDEMSQTATNQELRIHAFQTSTSWRLTRPVRAVKIGARSIAAFPRSIVRQVLEGALGQVRKNPALASAVRGTVALVPPLNRRLRTFSTLRAPIPAATHTPQSVPPGADERVTPEWWAAAKHPQGSAQALPPLFQRAEVIQKNLDATSSAKR